MTEMLLKLGELRAKMRENFNGWTYQDESAYDAMRAETVELVKSIRTAYESLGLQSFELSYQMANVGTIADRLYSGEKFTVS